uniref:hypothetical protein n=1 Tax=Microbispora cellulosiformans TaxID=2614688 RepID=UPI00177C6E1E|nr:hypothetical protein [Microbispora cellulosiformans]
MQEWKTEGVYPYAAGPSEPAQAVEREMLDEVAARVARRLPGATQGRLHRHVGGRQTRRRCPGGAVPDIEAVGGRGLWLVDGLATAWGTWRDDAGATVWFRVAARR